jgi:hypothetical protein
MAEFENDLCTWNFVLCSLRFVRAAQKELSPRELGTKYKAQSSVYKVHLVTYSTLSQHSDLVGLARSWNRGSSE